MLQVVSIIVIGAAFLSYNLYHQVLLRSPALVVKLVDQINRLSDSTSFNTLKNRYLSGSYKPVQEETFNWPVEIVEGDIPADVSGLFVRIGPNPKIDHYNKRYHVFDGDGMIHALRITNEQAIYSNQWLRTPRFVIEEEYKKSVFVRIGEIKGLLGLFKVLFVQPLLHHVFKLQSILLGTANTAMLFYNDRLYACHEGSLPFEIRWIEANNSFYSVGYETLGGKLDHAVSAHSRVDPIDGGWYFNGYNLEGADGGMKYGAASGGELRSYFTIKQPVKSFAHDMLITTNYVIFFESSVIFDTSGIMEGDFFRFSEDHKMRIGVMPKGATSEEDVVWFESDRAYSIIHGMNAWEVREEPGADSSSAEIVVCAHLGFDFDALNPESEFGENKFYLAQLRMNLQDASRVLNVSFFDTETMTEFPNVHPSYFGRPAQFGFSGQFLQGDEGFTQLVKWDIFSRSKVATLNIPSGLIAGEPIPIPKQQRQGEASGDGSDDVYLAVFAHDRVTIAGQWLLFDGNTMSDEPVVRISLGGKSVPNGFHGMWLPENKLQAHLNYTAIHLSE